MWFYIFLLLVEMLHISLPSLLVHEVPLARVNGHGTWSYSFLLFDHSYSHWGRLRNFSCAKVNVFFLVGSFCDVIQIRRSFWYISWFLRETFWSFGRPCNTPNPTAWPTKHTPDGLAIINIIYKYCYVSRRLFPFDWYIVIPFFPPISPSMVVKIKTETSSPLYATFYEMSYT